MNDLTLADVVQPGPGDRRRSARAAEKRRKKRRRRTWVSALIALGIIAAALSLAWLTVRPILASFNEPKDYPGPGTGDVTVAVVQGQSVTVIGKTLQQADVVKTVGAFVDAVTASGAQNKIQPGLYALRKQMTSKDAVAVLADPANRLVDKVTIPEGKRATEILAQLAGKGKITQADLDAAVKAPDSIGLPPEAKGSVEGWLFPATYEITPQTTATDILTEMVRRTQQELSDLGVPRENWLGKLTLASLVQAESGSVDDSPKIARVLQNRLDKKVPLQLDTTVNYALKRYKVAVSYDDTKVNSPYNTYLRPGLPVGPICSPGTVSLQAAIKPAPGPWMFFVATDPSTGKTEYGVTEADFKKLKAKLDAWIAAHPNG